MLPLDIAGEVAGPLEELVSETATGGDVALFTVFVMAETALGDVSTFELETEATTVLLAAGDEAVDGIAVVVVVLVVVVVIIVMEMPEVVLETQFVVFLVVEASSVDISEQQMYS